MASCGNEIERWNLKQAGRTAEWLEPAAPQDYTNRLSPAKSVSNINHLLHLPAKVDSAYSSFSGGSNVPEYHAPQYCNEHCCLPLQQLPYMDSEYVRGIYNPNAVNSDLKYKSLELSSHHNSYNIGLNGQSTPTHGTLYQPPLPLARPPSSLSQPPSPPARLDSYKATKGRSNSGNHFENTVQLAAFPQDTSNGLLPSNSITNWLSRSKNEELNTEESEEWGPSQDITKKNSLHVYTRPSSFIFQEYLKSDSLGNTQKLSCAHNSVHAYKIPEEMNSKPSLPLHTNLSAVNDTQENKQYFYACSVHKSPFIGADLQSKVTESSQRERQIPCIQCPFWAEDHSNLDQDALESKAGLKYMDSPVPKEDVSKKLNSYEDKHQHSSSEEASKNDIWEPLLNPQTPMQKPLQSQSLDNVERDHAHRGELGLGHKSFYDGADSTSYFRPNEGSTSHFLNGAKREKQTNKSSPDLTMNPKQEETLNPVRYTKHQLEFQKKLESQPQDDAVSEKINRQTTPLLYYLSGGKNTDVLSHKNQKWQQEDSGSLPKKSPRSHCPASTQPIEIQGEGNQLRKSKHKHQCMSNDTISETDDGVLGSPASSLDESFMNDYREKLKVAQKKVLRETSFKRKDLQMSLPIRLRQKPSRPSIEHLRSFSLTSAKEAAKLIPPPESLEYSGKYEEPKRPQTARMGGRKRITKEQKKLCYSEPEKLNQLDDQKDNGMSWREENAGTRSDEMSEQEAAVARKRTLENRGRVLSSSNISKTELKQIQHTALIEYMERKISQRPASVQPVPSYKPPLQQRPSNAKWFSECKTSNPNSSRKNQSNEVFCQFSPEKYPDLSPSSSACIPPVMYTNRNSACSTAAETVLQKCKSAVKETEGSCTSRCASADNLPRAGASASSKGRERSKSTPPPERDLNRSAAYPEPSTQECEKYPILPSFPSKNEINLAKEKEVKSISKPGGRGRSMEEIGISETVRLSLLSQSTDQLHLTKTLHISPAPGLELWKNSTATNHQSSLKRPRFASGNLSKQANTENTVGLKGSDTTVQTLEKLLSTAKPYGIFFNTENLTPHCISFLGTLQSPLVYSESPLQSPLAMSPDEDNVFLNDSSTCCLEIASPCLHGQEMPASSLTGLSLQVASEGEQSKAVQKASLHILEKDGSNLRDSNEGNKDDGAGNTCCLDVRVVTPEMPSPVPRKGGDEDTQVEEECKEKSVVGSALLKTPRSQLGANDIALPQDNVTCCHTASLAQSNSGEKDESNSSSLNNKAQHGSHDHVFPEKQTNLPEKKLKSCEDQRYEELAMEIIAEDKSLVDVLMPHPVRKTALDLMEGLFPVNISMLDRSYRNKGAKTREKMQSVQEYDRKNSECPMEPAPETEHSPDQRTEDPMSNMNQVLIKSRDGSNDLGDITSKKKELISSIQSKLQTLWEERELVLSETKEYEVRGKELEAVIQDFCKPNEYERYMMFIGDLEKVVSLLLCLSSRLARVQNAMRKIDENTDAEEKQSLNERHNLLSRQREDAKDLKENLDRRERVVSGILAKYLTEKQLQDYKHFVQGKTSLLIEQKDLEERIKFLEEQLESLEKSIPL
ncbi:PREDICTED: protein Shroom1 isoform X1 [Gavialis gangeticus]|uniref:protein Shroom1 isoform X1 n=1 Tax=Gavialis gangeticus TaxID=94835 RepID=UPI00092E6354|nr:PREDICTED: protein Shroom1 isoform X1 [Gavialis gangeticus]